MATRAVTVVKTQQGDWLATWAAMTDDGDDAGGSFELPGGCRSVTVQFAGTFGNDGQFSVQGSNDGTNWVTLRSKSQVASAGVNNAATITAAAIIEILELPRFIRGFQVEGEPSVTTVVMTALARGR